MYPESVKLIFIFTSLNQVHTESQEIALSESNGNLESYSVDGFDVITTDGGLVAPHSFVSHRLFLWCSCAGNDSVQSASARLQQWSVHQGFNCTRWFSDERIEINVKQ